MQQLQQSMRDATTDAPPSSIVIDEIVVREQQRRTRLRLLAVAGVVVIAAGAAPVVAEMTAPEPPPPATHLPTPSLADLSGWNERARSVAEAALPDGLRFEHPEEWGWPENRIANDLTLMSAMIGGPNEGLRSRLHIHLESTGQMRPPDDVCATRHPPARIPGSEFSCLSTTVDEVTLRVATWRYHEPGLSAEVGFVLVSRYQNGWGVHVWEDPAAVLFARPAVFPDHPAYHDVREHVVFSPVFTAEQLGELAVHPGLVPPTGR